MRGFLLHISRRKQPVHRQALLTKAAVKWSKARIIRGFIRPGAGKRSVLVAGPAVGCLADKLATIVDLDAFGQQAQLLGKALHRGHDRFALERLAHVNG